MYKLFILVSLACCAVSSGFGKEVAAGTTETITEDTTLDENLTVRGTLNVIGAKLTLKSGRKLTVAAGSNGPWANLNLKDAQLVLPTDNWDVYPLVAENDRYGQITLDNSTMTANRMVMANNTQWCRASLTLSNNSSVVLSGGPLTMNSKYEAIAAGNTRKSWVTLGEGCRLQAVYLTGCDNLRCGVYFAGGTLAVRRVTVEDSCKLFLKGINGHPIRLEALLDTNDRSQAMFAFASNTENARVLLGAESPSDLTPVDCGFVKTGTLDAPFVLNAYQDRVLFNYTGETRIETAGTTLTAANQLPSGGDVFVGLEATLRLGGYSQTFGSFTGGGLVTNNSETAAVITLNVPENVTKTYSADAPCGPVSLVKTGAGTLVAQKSTFGGVTVQDGAVEFADPMVTGYPQYQFYVDRPYGDTYSGLAYNELSFYDGDINVTTPFGKASSPNIYSMHNNLFDHDPTTFLWQDCTYNDNPLGTRGWVTAAYAVPFKITSFTWTSFDNTPPSFDWCRDPGAWRFRGRYNGGEWVTLHSMTNKGYSLTARQTETEKFPVTYPQTSVSLGGATFTGGSLALPANVSAKVPAGQTFTATGSSVVLSSLAVDCAAENGTVVGGTVAATGKLYLTNVPSRGLRSGTRIPLTFSNTAVASGFKKWDLYVDGVLQEKHWAVFEDGQFAVGGFGMTLIFR